MEYAIFFENGAWHVMRQEFGTSFILESCPTLETAIMALSLITNFPVGIKMITKNDSYS